MINQFTLLTNGHLSQNMERGFLFQPRGKTENPLKSSLQEVAVKQFLTQNSSSISEKKSFLSAPFGINPSSSCNKTQHCTSQQYRQVPELMLKDNCRSWRKQASNAELIHILRKWWGVDTFEYPEKMEVQNETYSSNNCINLRTSNPLFLPSHSSNPAPHQNYLYFA